MRPGTRAACGMSEADAQKRAKLATLSRQKLRNLHMYIFTFKFSRYFSIIKKHLISLYFLFLKQIFDQINRHIFQL